MLRTTCCALLCALFAVPLQGAFEKNTSSPPPYVQKFNRGGSLRIKPGILSDSNEFIRQADALRKEKIGNGNIKSKLSVISMNGKNENSEPSELLISSPSRNRIQAANPDERKVERSTTGQFQPDIKSSAHSTRGTNSSKVLHKYSTLPRNFVSSTSLKFEPLNATCIEQSHSTLRRSTAQSQQSKEKPSIPNEIGPEYIPYRSSLLTRPSQGSTPAFKLCTVLFTSVYKDPNELVRDIKEKITKYAPNTVVTCCIQNIVLWQSVVKEICDFIGSQLNSLRSFKIIGCKGLEHNVYRFDSLYQSKLYTFSLENNELCSTHLNDLLSYLPSSIRELTMIKNDWEDTKITINPKQVKRFFHLQKIVLKKQKLSQTDVVLIDAILNLKQVREIDLSGNEDISCFFQSLLKQAIRTLNSLNLSENNFSKITPQLFRAFFNIGQLGKLIVQNCNLYHLTFEIEEFIRTCESFEEINMLNSSIDESMFFSFYIQCTEQQRSKIRYQFKTITNEVLRDDNFAITECVDSDLKMTTEEHLRLFTLMLDRLAFKDNVPNFIHLPSLKRFQITALVNEDFYNKFMEFLMHTHHLTDIKVTITDALFVPPDFFELDLECNDFNFIQHVSITIIRFECEKTLVKFLCKVLQLFNKSNSFDFYHETESLQWLPSIVQAINEKDLKFPNCSHVEFSNKRSREDNQRVALFRSAILGRQ